MILRIGPSLIKYSLLCRHISTSDRKPAFRYYLHCIVFIGSYCSSLAARLSRYSPAYSLVVRYLLGTESAPLSEDEDVMSPTVGSVHNAGRDCGFDVCRNPNLKPVKTKKLPSTAYNTVCSCLAGAVRRMMNISVTGVVGMHS